jgi:hypothetical protein
VSFDFSIVQNDSIGRNCTWNFEFCSFPGLTMWSDLLSGWWRGDRGSELQLTISPAITGTAAKLKCLSLNTLRGYSMCFQLGIFSTDNGFTRL